MKGLAGYLLLTVAFVFATYAAALWLSGQDALLQIVIAVILVALSALVYRMK
jgi:hypothetical protein